MHGMEPHNLVVEPPFSFAFLPLPEGKAIDDLSMSYVSLTSSHLSVQSPANDLSNLIGRRRQLCHKQNEKIANRFSASLLF